jgi:hypothetical protein
MPNHIFTFILAEKIAYMLKRKLLNDDINIIKKNIKQLDKKYRNLPEYDKLEVYSNSIINVLDKTIPDMSATIKSDTTKSVTSNKFDTTKSVTSNKFDTSAFDNTNIDTHQYQISQIGNNTTDEKSEDTINTSDAMINSEISKLLSLKQTKDIISLFNPKSQYKSKLIILDSYNQVDDLNGTGVMAWDIIPSRDFLQGAINTSKSIRNIVGMKLSTFRMVTTNSLLYASNPIARWTVCIEEMKAQSFIGPLGQKFNGRSQLYSNTNPNVATLPSYSNPCTYTEDTAQRRFHFMVGFDGDGQQETDTVGQFMYMDYSTHNFNDGYFWFRKPFSVLPDRLTLSFGCPFNIFPIKSNKVTGLIGMSPTTNQLSVSFANQINAFDPSTNPYLFGSLLLTGFTTANPIADAALIASVNNHYFTKLFCVNRNVLLFPIDLTGITLVPNSNMNVYTFVSYRVIFPLEIIYTDE